MSSCCCSDLTCPWEQVTRSAKFVEEAIYEGQDQDEGFASVPTRMDIALLKEQYNWIKEKQRNETRVVMFKKAASNKEEISGKSLISVVPMCQSNESVVRHKPSREVEFDFVRDPERAPWRTHLGLHRMASTNNCIELQQQPDNVAANQNSAQIDSLSSDRSESNTDSSDKLSLSSEDPKSDYSLESRTEENPDPTSSRKLSAPAVLSRQRSFGGYKASHIPMSPIHYPFPHLKCPKKSEAARRLGMYSSF
ncbi:uncharacterized protein C9orf152-like [Chanos chanos]|uniref:Uncharacterized protein C9orf152-like n=1 Tax=Chanos chanos TaxID=29144 RepID=A0A6J2V0Q0_CHACN|nr:uncharacterized protein C9orf152 homolog [Chanos chanos]